MPRRARLGIPGIPWHIIQRGNNRAVCFYAEADYLFYLEHLDALARRFGCAIHAYVLMTNHVHRMRPALPRRLNRRDQVEGEQLEAAGANRCRC